MVEDMKGSMSMIKNMVMEHLYGLMGESMLEIGVRGSKMEGESILCRMEHREWESGQKGRS